MILFHHCCEANIVHFAVEKMAKLREIRWLVQRRSNSKHEVQKVGEQVSLDSSQTQPHPSLAFGKILMDVPTSLLPCYPSSLREASPLPLLGPFPTNVPAYTVPQMPCNPNFTVLPSQESSKTSLNTPYPILQQSPFPFLLNSVLSLLSP